MRVLLTTLLAATLTAGPALAADCLRSPDHVAMDVMALKTQLMVTALTCKVDERYNAFVLKYQPDLQREDKLLTAYFSRSYGRSGQKQRDDYVTQLANSRSQTGLRQGSLFCEQNIPVFDEVMALHGNAELTDYAAGRAGEQPISVNGCGGGSTGGGHTATRTTHRRR